jgi:hypothetical protein
VTGPLVSVDCGRNQQGFCAIIDCPHVLGTNAIRWAHVTESPDGSQTVLYDIAICRNHPDLMDTVLKSVGLRVNLN